ncbi:MAG TPA: sigma-70 family RNA polymerase sigma factor [Chthonomonadales bacterium]|nr:sigma-70 family RNA polymerase sigma factor [Chthonomonadales bacterium]
MPVSTVPSREHTETEAAEFEALVDRTYSRAYSAAYRLMGNASDAEDLTQEAFVRVWAAFDRYDRARPFEGWLFRIISNLAIDKWRRIGAAAVCSLDSEAVPSRPVSAHRGRLSPSSSGEAKGAPLLACLADERPSAMPEQSYFRAEDGRRVRRALSALPGDYRKAVVLADVKGYSYEEIARYVGCPVGTIRSRLHRGRQLLRQNLLNIQRQEEDHTERRDCPDDLYSAGHSLYQAREAAGKQYA